MILPSTGATPSSPAPSPIDALTDLAMNLRWTWSHCADALWNRLDPALWERTRHPNEVLREVAKEKLAAALADPEFCRELERVHALKRASETTPGWFQTVHPNSPLSCIAYFCMEFMLSEALPIYSGGLGNVAGDQLKAASDLGVPVVGVGLLYQHGYFRQVIDHDGAQQASYPYNDPTQMPITPLRQADGSWLRLKIVLPGDPVWLRVWQVQVGRVKLYLLDTNDGANTPALRGITSELYGGGTELRLKQEMLLGLGGWRLLRTLGLQPEVCHLNEGHAAFAILERAHCFMMETGQSFAVALMATKAGNIFTTHTAVAAGFDRFSPALIDQYLGWYARDHLGISLYTLLALGRLDPNNPDEPFNMAYLALRGSTAVNGVSRLHGQVSRRLFAPLFPRWPEREVPIGYITNGVHMPTWDSAAADTLWTEACGKERWLGSQTRLEQHIRGVSAEKIWAQRTANRENLITYVRERLGQQLRANGVAPAMITRTQNSFRPEVLTLGFARRFATYKRPNLLLHDPARLLRLLNHPERPAQLLIAGKAHPADLAGQALIRAWTNFVRENQGTTAVAFVADYDMLLAEHLVQGVDVWINTPRRPWEACGTSGMKVLVNGGLNLSEIDGWWAEAYRPDVGWALGDGQEHREDPEWDAAEADALYERLEHEVIPEFYARASDGRPTAWLNRVRESMAQLTPRFSASRAVRDYTEQRYLPAALAVKTRSAEKGAEALRLVKWQEEWQKARGAIAFGPVTVVTHDGQHFFAAEISLRITPVTAVNVQLYSEGPGPEAVLRVSMASERHKGRADGDYIYRAAVSATRPAQDYTVRISPHLEGLGVPLEEAWVLWQK